MRDREFRRQQYERMKTRALRDLRQARWRSDARAVGKRVSTRQPCSCWMCGNPRRHFKQATMQEIRSTAKFVDDVENLPLADRA